MKRPSRVLWGVFILLDSLLILFFSAALAARIADRLELSFLDVPLQPVHLHPTPPGRKPAPAPQPAPAAMAAVPAVAPKPAAPPPVLKAKRVMFELLAAQAKTVSLTGSFLKWEQRPMARFPDGSWKTTLFLLPGAYRYQFIVEGKKTLDPRNPLKQDGLSLLVIPEN